MIKKLIFHLLPFLLPFVIYASYVLLTKRAAAKGKVWHDAPWYWLVSTGLVLVIASLILWAELLGGGAGQTYVPAVLKDGEVVPGHFE